MGSKVNPNGLRFGINKNWRSRWNPKDNNQMGDWLVQDDKIRTELINKYKSANIDRIEIERTQSEIFLFIYAAQPGVLLGEQGANLTKIKLLVNKIVGRKITVHIEVITIQNPDLNARLIAREIADAIENRVSFRNAQKFGMRKAMKAGAKGVKTHVSGRLGGVEMAREEGYSQGIITLSTLRSDIDYALEEANTTYGIIGVKVWINRGEIFNKSNNKKPFTPKTDKKPNFNKKPQDGNSGAKKPSFNNNNKKPSSKPTTKEA